jgi:hypothetical protein
VDKLGFVKTLEAILAAIVAVSMYNFVQGYTVKQVEAVSRTPEAPINDFLNVIDLETIVNDYDYLRLDSLFYNLLYETIYYYFEPTYYERVIVVSDSQKSWPNISFTYHFPQGIDKNSIRMVSGNYELPTNASFNWYRVPVTFNESITDNYVEVNISVDESNINKNSLKFFVREKESLLSINYWNESPSEFNASLIVYIPEIEEDERAYVYFSKSIFINQSYPSLALTKNVESLIFNKEEARSAQVVFSPDNISPSTNTFYIKYKLFSNDKNNYYYFSSINNTGLSINKDNSIKQGSSPFTVVIKGESSVKKLIPLNNGYCELIIYGGYS